MFYLDGALASSSTVDTPGGTMLSDAAIDLRAGNRAALDLTFDGKLDELRLSTTSRSAGWITTQYKNQTEPAAFVIVGPEL